MVEHGFAGRRKGAGPRRTGREATLRRRPAWPGRRYQDAPIARIGKGHRRFQPADGRSGGSMQKTATPRPPEQRWASTRFRDRSSGIQGPGACPRRALRQRMRGMRKVDVTAIYVKLAL